MSLNEVWLAARALPRRDKLLLVQELIPELALEEMIPTGEYPIGSPCDAHEAAAMMLQMLEQQKARTI
jgi:hypothetical protein